MPGAGSAKCVRAMHVQTGSVSWPGRCVTGKTTRVFDNDFAV